MAVTCGPATRTKTRPSVSQDDPAEVRLLCTGRMRLGAMAVKIEWPEPFRGEVRDIRIPIEHHGTAQYVEIEGDGFIWVGEINPIGVNVGDTVTFPSISLPVR